VYGNASVDEWTTRYEAVRQRAIVVQHPEQSGWELALLVRRGVAAWMLAWPTTDETQPSHHASDGPSGCCPATDVALPASLCEQITAVLVSMILPQRSLELESI
jgi:hypothetical protein